MSKQFTITITNNETNEVETLETEGYVFMGVDERSEKQLDFTIGVDTVTPNEIGRMVRRLASPENDKDIAKELQKVMFASVASDAMSSVLGGVISKMMKPEDDCDCENCVARRAKEAAAAEAEVEAQHESTPN